MPSTATLDGLSMPSEGVALSESASALATAASEPAVVADSLTKRFGSVLAVDSLSFALEPGTITGFLGPNGAGKTTTLRMLLGLAAAERAARALIFGQPYAELERAGAAGRRGARGDRLPSGPLRP